MVKQRKSGTSDVLRSPSKVVDDVKVSASPVKKVKSNGVAEEANNGGSSPTLNGKRETPKGKRGKSLTMGQLAEQQRADSDEKHPETSTASLAVQITQGLMSNDVTKLDSVLRESRVELIQATLLDIQVSQIVPLLKALFERVNTRSAINIKPWILWIQCILSLHASYLSSLRTLETELGGLLEWMRHRLGHQQKLLELHGRLSTIGEQIERRMNRTVIVAPQPLIVFNDDVDSDMEELESGGSDESGASSEEEEEDWWDEGGLGAGDDNEEEEDDDSDDGSDIGEPARKSNHNGGNATDDSSEEEGSEDEASEDEMDIG
ncbi:hypothetical protein Q1695_003599 [Nippostrongylus brasiliensis]|nr:hypothetical protein Q1695_003599 [Nippostrongylus brasiliensis]